MGICLCLARASESAVFYVDPADGDDGNSGLSRAAPWKTIPGTRSVDDTQWLRPAWGAVNSGNKIKGADTLEIKAGTRMSAAVGGRLLIDGTFYENLTPTAAIRLTVSSDWGNGPFVLDAGEMRISPFRGGVEINRVDGVQLSGTPGGQNWQVTRVQGAWAILVYGAETNPVRGFKLDYVEVMNASEGGLNLSFAEDWAVTRSSFHHNGTAGLALGYLADDPTRKGLIEDCLSYQNGNNSASNGLGHGFVLWGGTGITVRRCEAFNNLRTGFEVGNATNEKESSVSVFNSSAHDNGEDGFGVSGSYVSFKKTNRSLFLRDIAYNNQQSGWHIRRGAQASLYHVIAHDNGVQNGYGGNFFIQSEAGAPVNVTLKNSIGYKPKTYANVFSFESQGEQAFITSGHNLFVPRASDKEILAETPFGLRYSYLDVLTKGRKPDWVSSSDEVGLKQDPKFVSAGPSFATLDYHVQPGSPAINAGLPLPDIPESRTDLDGNPVDSQPDCGLYEFRTGKAQPRSSSHPGATPVSSAWPEKLAR